MTPARGYRGGGGSDSTGFLFVVIVIGVGALMWLSWQSYHPQISAAAMRIAHWEMQTIGEISDRFRLADAQVMRANPATVKFDQLVRLYRNIGAFVLYPAAGFTAGLAALCFVRAGNQRYSRRLDLEGLMREQAKSFPFISWTLGRKLGLAGMRKDCPRPADPALRPEEWVKFWATGEDGHFNEDMAREALGRQLGASWRGVETASRSVKCMLAAFALHHACQRDRAIAFLGHLSASLPFDSNDGPAGPEQPLTFSSEAVEMADEVLNDQALAAGPLAAMGRHFYATTGLMTVLCEARARAGALAPAQFAFLKLVDRNLWWALHSLGFESDGPRAHPHPCPRAEALAARSHWEAERGVGHALAHAELDSAVAAVMIAGSKRVCK
ncbi:intracellular multiplication protein IcmP [Rhodoblastus acidophilus]|uniref:secretion/conjugation apparatus DotM-related subunit n=1 Tax=Rhodoblastus acidophilus TaxID=1074 RepID=UPI0022251F2A|nr:hypothetical protein [Rhodoblastus acidophilus]MCW2318614.1 intracellular multiplication protein IcmP [Rhodoblastus acidophilus]